MGKADFQIVCFGDSTTDANYTSDEYTSEYAALKVYSQRLQEELPQILDREVQVINSGVSGETTTDAKSRFQDDVLKHKPHLVIIQFGANDQCIRQDYNLEEAKVSLDQYVYNLLHFIGSIKKLNSKIILLTPGMMLWNDSFKSKYFKKPYELNEKYGLNGNLNHYVLTLKKIAEREQVACIDIFQKEMEYDRMPNQSLQNFLPDGLHPNNKGHQFIAQSILEHIKNIEL